MESSKLNAEKLLRDKIRHKPNAQENILFGVHSASHFFPFAFTTIAALTPSTADSSFHRQGASNCLMNEAEAVIHEIERNRS
jgi:hypothetical protein